jgi:CHAD domain
MARGGRVKGIRTKAPLQENAQRIIAFRLAELVSWRHATADPGAIIDLHNLRIAAKRLRYALEIFELCFPAVKPMLQKLTDLQESVGDIHDLDVLVEIIRERLRHVDGDMEKSAVKIMQASATASERSNQLRQLLYAQARDRQRLGLIGLLGDYIAARETQYAKFQKHWGGVAMDSFEADLLGAIDMSGDEKVKIVDSHPNADSDPALEGAVSGG